jgi:hypothetical protein
MPAVVNPIVNDARNEKPEYVEPAVKRENQHITA